MDMRQRVAMRRLVDVTMEQIRVGAVQPADAAQALHGAGVPFKVIGRVVDQAVQERSAALRRGVSSAITQDKHRARAPVSLSLSAA